MDSNYIRVAKRTTHGENGKSRTPEYISWYCMRRRCLCPSDKDFKYYGGRGIKVCKRWDDYRLFLKDMGRKPNKKFVLDRLNVDGDYKPSNCTWAPRSTQQWNTRRSTKVTYKGKRMPLPKLAADAGLPSDVALRRIKKYGWSVERTLRTPRKVKLPSFFPRWASQ